jgi:hypothetical protein
MPLAGPAVARRDIPSPSQSFTLLLAVALNFIETRFSESMLPAIGHDSRGPAKPQAAVAEFPASFDRFMAVSVPGQVATAGT